MDTVLGDIDQTTEFTMTKSELHPVSLLITAVQVENNVTSLKCCL